MSGQLPCRVQGYYDGKIKKQTILVSFIAMNVLVKPFNDIRMQWFFFILWDFHISHFVEDDTHMEIE